MSGAAEGETVDLGDGKIALGDLSGLADGEKRCFLDIGEHGLVVCRAGGTLYALDDNCSHADTPLSEGRLRGFGLTCPLHGASFDVRDGSHSGPPAWEGVACHEVDESSGVAIVTVRPRRGRSDDVGGRLRTR